MSVKWNHVNNDKGLRWLRHYTRSLFYTVYTSKHKDRRGRRISLLGIDGDGNEKFQSIEGISFSSDEIADAAEQILDENRKESTDDCDSEDCEEAVF